MQKPSFELLVSMICLHAEMVGCCQNEPVHGESQKGFEKMNDQQLQNKVRKDAAKLKKDLTTLVQDSTIRFSRFEDKVRQDTGKAQKDLSTWVEDSTSQLNKRLEELTSTAKKAVVGTATEVKKDVAHGLSQYNKKAQLVVDKVPGDIGKKAARYPWVSITAFLVFGFVLGVLLKPARQPIG